MFASRGICREITESLGQQQSDQRHRVRPRRVCLSSTRGDDARLTGDRLCWASGGLRGPLIGIGRGSANTSSRFQLVSLGSPIDGQLLQLRRRECRRWLVGQPGQVAGKWNSRFIRSIQGRVRREPWRWRPLPNSAGHEESLSQINSRNLLLGPFTAPLVS